MRRNPVSTMLVATLAAAAMLVLVMPTSANHTQTDLGKAIVFDHKTGNIHWVEVDLRGTDASKVTKVEVQVGAPGSWGWRTLPKQSWGSYGASIPIGDPADVRFRATFMDGTRAVSCWFKHPVGTEACSYAAPPGNWRSTALPDAGFGFGGEAEVVDIDRDGVGELVVAAEDGLFVMQPSGTGWSRDAAYAADGDTFTAETDFRLLAIGSTDNDDVLETYTAGRHYDGERAVDRVMWHHFTGEQWYSDVVWDFSMVHDMVLGDVDDDGRDELYVVVTENTNTGSSLVVYQVIRSPGEFYFKEAARLFDAYAGRAAVGDADRDLDDELYLLYRKPDGMEGVLRIDQTGDYTFPATRFVEGQYGQELTGFAVGDGDNDGLDEMYLLATGFFPGEAGNVYRFSHRDAGWVTTTIPIGKGFHYGLTLGDGNGDGFRELYSGTIEGHLMQLMWTGSAWSARAVMQPGDGEFIADVALGDTGGDGKTETYAVTYESPINQCCPRTNVLRMAPTTTTTTTTTSTTGGTFDATFSGVRGNEWWVQASVNGNGQTVSKVDVRLNGGAWQPVTKQSWGWGSSYHIVQGTVVQLRATSASGATDVSDCYRWIPPSGADATKVACSGSTTTTSTTTTTTGSAFDASFSGVKGNEWWVQANVAANQQLAGVDARVNCAGTWKPLTKQDWGGWAASFNVPAGSKVDFRARSTSGATDLSGGYIWTAATPTTGC